MCTAGDTDFKNGFPLFPGFIYICILVIIIIVFVVAVSPLTYVFLFCCGFAARELNETGASFLFWQPVITPPDDKESALSKSQSKIWTGETGPGEKDHQKR